MYKWRRLTINRPSAHATYTRFLSSKHSAQRLENVKTLLISKPIESRHAHLTSLPFTLLPNVNSMYTFNLCLAEIEFLSQQFQETKAQLHTLVCDHIETWCDMKNFSLRMVENLSQLTRAEFKFAQDGRSGFASMHSRSYLYESPPNKLKEFSVTCIHDEEVDEQLGLIHQLEHMERNREELYTQRDIDQANTKRVLVLRAWRHNNLELLNKYQFFYSLKNMKRFEFGFCYAWTSQMWRECFKSVIVASPHLMHLSLHGWSQLGKLVKTGVRSATVQPFRVDAEEAIAECFETMGELKSLKLVDFSVGPGLLRGANAISKSIQHLEIIFTKYFVKYIAEPADVWLLFGPMKEFILAAFSSQSTEKRTVIIHLQKELLYQINNSAIFSDEPLLPSIQAALQGDNVEIKLLEYSVE